LTRYAPIALMVILALPGVALRLSGAHPDPVIQAIVFGVAILAAAFLLAWAAEALQVDVSQGLAIAVVALIAVLPEYAVDIAFAVRAGSDPSQAPYAIANMTGANRLLVGIGWPVVFGLFWWKARRYVLELDRGHAIEVLALAIATIFSFSILFADGITIFHSVVFTAIFIGYVILIARAPVEEPHLVGPAQTLGAMAAGPRRVSVGAMIVFAAGAVVASAEPFAESLIGAGVELGVDEFLLVQWVAPFASEAPEFLIASLLAFGGRPSAGIGTLVSSKVNQWTLLIASLPVAYAIGGGGWSGLPFDDRQWEELFITAAQSLLAVVLIARLRFAWWGAAVLLVLFLIQFAIPSSEVRTVIAWIYLALSAIVVLLRPAAILGLWRTARDVVASHGGGSAA
jgi:cation:H+ antiporter